MSPPAKEGWREATGWFVISKKNFSFGSYKPPRPFGPPLLGRRGYLIFITFLILTAIYGVAADPPHLVERTATSMGSELQLTAWTADEPTALSAFGAVFQESDRLDGLMSNWRDGSDILRL